MKSKEVASQRAVLLLALFLAVGLEAQEGPGSLLGREEPFKTAPGAVTEIPFRLVNNHLILPVSINGSRPLDVVLDTGMPTGGVAIYDGPRLTEVGLSINPSMEAQIGGAGGGERQMAKVAMNENLSIAGLEIEGVRVIVMPEMPQLSGYHDGIIGYSLFGSYAVELDFDSKLVRLYEPGTYGPLNHAAVVPLAFHGNVPYATVTIEQEGQPPLSGKVHIDLGASHPISLYPNSAEGIVLPAKTVATVIGRGISGPVRGHVGRVAAVTLGGYRLADVVTTFPVKEHQNPRGIDSLAGNLGSGILQRFNTTFDYANQRMLLVPNSSHGAPFVYDQSGIRLATGKHLKVEHVAEGSPAAEAGVETDDLVTHLDGRAVTSDDYVAVREALMATGQVRLTLQRGASTIEKTLQLRRLV